MDFTPHTDAEIAGMLSAVGLSEPADLFSHIPTTLQGPIDPELPTALSEMEVMAHITALGALNESDLVCFAGGGIYDHYLPPVVRSLTMRPEFVTSYTPYQSEVAQGVLQALWEYQSMIASVTGLPVANASLFDGPFAGMEAVNLALADGGAVWVSRGVHPHTRQILQTFCRARDIDIVEHPLIGGSTVWDEKAGPPPGGMVFAQPNYLGVIEDYSKAVGVAKKMGARSLVAVDLPLLGILRTPGDAGCDVAFAEGQPMGNPMSFGGPALGVFATTRELLRRVPGRLVGRTVDQEGRVAYTLTLRAREQDIRREKASSNICTNQTLNAIAAAIHLGWLGPEGLAETGRQSVAKAHYLADLVTAIPGVHAATTGPFGREFAILLPDEPGNVLKGMAERGYLAGIDISSHYPEFPAGLLVAVTEKRTREQLDGYTAALREVLGDA